MENNNINCNYDVTGINAQFGYNSSDENNNMNDITKNQLLDKIRELNFAITDLSEYLNTHPTDEKALCLHQKYANELRNLEDKYNMMFGPLTIYCPCKRWKWLENPWPWEGSEE